MTKLVRFRVTLEADILVDPAVLAVAQTDEWRSHFYDMSSDEDVARHLAWNLVQGRSLANLDGFADQDESKCILETVSDVDCERIKTSVTRRK